MNYTLVNFGNFITKEKKQYFYVDVLVKDENKHHLCLKRIFINDERIYQLLCQELNNDIDIYSFNIGKYIYFSFTKDNNINFRIFEDLLYEDLT